jgi:hypothetical protein
VQILKSFNHSTTDIEVKAAAFRNGAVLNVVYKVIDTKNLLNLPASFIRDEHDVTRQDNLWMDTCFEMFLKPQDKNSYYEFNFSLKSAWNEYFFEEYRKPQPPKPCNDILFKNIHWTGQRLEVELYGIDPHKKYDLGLTAVIKEKSEKIHYMALIHAGDKADFHDQKSFILKI